jgi:GNAT superfamily N-acetyltransferase
MAPVIDRALAARLPSLHEAQERLETGNLLAAGLGPELGVETRTWDDGCWAVRSARMPTRHPGNQVMGIGEAQLADLGRFTPWFDEVGAWMHFRWPGPAIAPEVGDVVASHGFRVNELEAWMAAPAESLATEVTADVREVRSAADTEAFAVAFCGGWGITDPNVQRVALAAMAPWPGPASWRRYVGYVDGEPAAEALLVQFDDVAYLAEASTVPRFRRRGLHRSLLAKRVADARDAGARVIFGTAVYGDESWSNMRATGLREAFLTLTFRRPPA